MFLLIGAVLVVCNLYAKDHELSSSTSQLTIFSSIERREWVERCTEQYPEILWLADTHVRKTEEGQATLQGTYSEQLFGLKYIEFDRTIMTIHCLKLILDGSDQAYEQFTEAQPKDNKLTRGSFQILHLQGQRLLESRWHGLSKQQMVQAMETALVLGDMGKSEKARALLKPYGITAPDHDDFYGEAMHVIEKYPSLCPSFARLPCSAKQLIVKVANLAHYGHITHLEGGPQMFTPLKESMIPYKDPMALSFDLFIHICDVAGALGHMNNRSSLVYTEPTFRAMEAMAKAVKMLADPQKSEWDAYYAYLQVRAAWLGLNAENSSDRVLARIGAMLRLFILEEGTLLKKAMMQLDTKTRKKISEQLDMRTIQQLSRTPTYIPAVLVNLCNNEKLGHSKEDRLLRAVTIGLPFITRVLEKHKDMIMKNEIDSTIPLNFNKIAGVAKGSCGVFDRNFYIDKEGCVHLLSD